MTRKYIEKIKSKFKEGGIKEIVDAINYRIVTSINKGLYYCYSAYPIVNNLIVFESEGDLTDNSFALFDYIKRNFSSSKLKIVWMVNDSDASLKYLRRQKLSSDTVLVQKFPKSVTPKRSYYLARCRYFIYDHSNMMGGLKKRKEQKIIYLTHGFAGYKAGKGSTGKEISRPDVVSVTSQLSEDLYPSFEDFGNATFIHAGMPRLDYFFEIDSQTEERVNRKFALSEYKKVFLWMPTFRESDHKAISENYINTETHLPILTSKKQLITFNAYLADNNLLMIFKVHPLQRRLPVFQEHYTNMLFLNDEQLHEINVQLYQFIPLTDALITDYSSVSADYMLLDKPMIFTLDDYEEYKTSRGGFIPKDPIDLWAGAHVRNEHEFYDAIQRVVDGFDDFKPDRDRLMPLFYDYPDGQASKRICDFLKIE